MNIIIPARGGSKRILNKNKKIFLGVPIIARVIDNLKSIPEITRIIISTDDPEIHAIAKSAGAESPFIRPQNLSDDYTNTISVIKHVLQELEINEDEIIGCVYSTSVFLNRDLISKVIQNVRSNPNVFTFFAKEFEHPIQRAFQLTEEKQVVLNEIDNLDFRTQDYKKFFHDAGQVYAGYKSVWQREEGVIINKSIAILDQNMITVDIDTEKDWKIAEILYNSIERTVRADG